MRARVKNATVAHLFAAVLALGLIGAGAEAKAAVCGAGAYHAGCVGPRGAVGVRRPVGGAAVVRRPYGAAVVRPVARPGVACVWRAGVRICR
jgi:hypothetical protein